MERGNLRVFLFGNLIRQAQRQARMQPAANRNENVLNTAKVAVLIDRDLGLRFFQQGLDRVFNARVRIERPESPLVLGLG